MKKKFNEYSPRWGFYSISEILNGRGAMVLLIVIIIIEILTQRTIIDLLLTLKP
uniref:hypothetical protein n=1 Tax=Analipus japonicus TaxID=31333 RepID=UPI002E7686B3|nr:hypothetical protein V2471_pgp019 [Analipus japonicus]WAM61978.1 hypothetical protein [Analipus japonicus]